MVPLLLTAAACCSILAARDTVERVLEQAVEPDYSLIDEEDVLSTQSGLEYAERLDWITEHPFDLNRVNREELLSLPGVSLSMAEALIGRRRREGRFRTIEEVRLVPDVGEELFRRISPYVEIPVVATAGRRKNTLRVGSSLREPAETNTLGPSAGAYVRFVASPVAGTEVGLVGEKDRGEPVRYGFAGAYVMTELEGTTLLVGDFSVGGGQGLVLGAGSAPGRSVSAAAQPGTRSGNLHPHRSTDEVRFYRGGAVESTVKFSRALVLSSIMFVSSRRLPASVDDSGIVTTILQANSVTTSALLGKSSLLKEDVIGAHVGLRFGTEASLGVTVLRSQFDREISHQDPLRMKGRRADAAGVDFRLETGPAALFGELAISGEGQSCLIGAAARVAPRADLTMLFRGYSPRYDNPHAMGFGDGSDVRNEWGCYAGLAWSPLPVLQVRGYVDRFRRIAPTPTEPLAGAGREEAIAFDGSVARRVRIALEFRWRSTETYLRVAGAGGREVMVPAKEGRDQLRCSFRHSLSKGGYVRVRAAGVRSFDTAGAIHMGLLLSQEYAVRVSEGLGATVGISLFRTDGYGARVFETEAGIPGKTQLVGMYGKGRRWFAALSACPVSGVTLHASVGSVETSPALTVSSAPVELASTRSWHGALQFDLDLDRLVP
jgi:hypothetical protein